MLSSEHVHNWVCDITSGDRKALSKAITLIESRKPGDRSDAMLLLKSLDPGRTALRIGVTGPPGVGKSSLLEVLGLHILDKGFSLAVLSIDPSSTLTRGSILGDKTRMLSLSQSNQAFIRPSPTGDQLGGITRTTREVIRLCEAAGFDFVFVETAGIGQTEYLVSTMVDLTILLQLPGSGDDLQGIKRGIMEWADILVLHKSDDAKDPKVLQALRDLRVAIQFLETKKSGWERKILMLSSLKRLGIEELWDAIRSYQKHINDNNYMLKNRNEQLINAYHQILQQQTWNSILDHQEVKQFIKLTEEKVYSLNLSPEEAVYITQDYIFAFLKQ